MKKRCPECGRKYVIPERHVGKKFNCVDCGVQIKTKPSSADLETEKPSTKFSSLPISLEGPKTDVSFERLPEMSPLQQSGWFKIGTILPFVIGVLLTCFALHYLYSQWQLQSRIADRTSMADGMAQNEAEKPVEPSGELDADETPPPKIFTAKEIKGFSPRKGKPPREEANKSTNANGQQASQRSDVTPATETRTTNTRALIIQSCPGFDPTVLQVDPLNASAILRKSIEQDKDCEALFFGSHYGSPEFLELYRSGLLSENKTLRFACAILSALWNQDVRRSLEIALNTIGSESTTQNKSDRPGSGGPLNTKLRVTFLNHVLERFPKLADEAMERVKNVGPPASQQFARSMLANQSEPGKYPALSSVAQSDPTRRYKWLRELATEGGGEAKPSNTPPAVGSLVEFQEGNSIFSFGFPDLAKEDFSLGYVFDVDQRLSKPQWPMLDASWARQDLKFDWPKYTSMKIYGVEFDVKRGPLIRIRTYLANQYSDKTYWDQSNTALPSPPILDRALKSQHDFDRVRYFEIDGVPKAQRYVRSGDYVIDFRWIGHNHDSHPAYLTLLMESLKVHPEKLEDAKRHNERVYQ